MPQPAANKWIRILHPCLEQAFAAVGERPTRSVQDLRLAPEKDSLSSKMVQNSQFRGSKTRKSNALSTVVRKNVCHRKYMKKVLDMEKRRG